ncbi:hypothetical protein WJ64_31730 [Burkholderia ubonensis]|nr:hypothetical protein WJ64_31730 [Burkholderia ubonensis]
MTAIDVIDQHDKDGNSGGGNIGLKSDGLATASFSYGKDDQVHRTAVQHGTLAVKDVQAKGGVSDNVNRDAGQVASVTDDRKIAGSKMTVEVGDLLEHLKKKVKSKSGAGATQADEGSGGPSRQARRAAPYDEGTLAQRVSKPVLGEPTEGTVARRGEDRYAQRVIVQQGDDAVTTQAAQRLANKHPENTVLVKADPKTGKLQGLEQVPQGTGKVKVQVVGHGDPVNGKLGDADAPALARQVAQVKTQLGKDIDVSKVTLVGCKTACKTETEQPSLTEQMQTELVKIGTDVGEVNGRTDYVKVDRAGQKLDTTVGDPDGLPLPPPPPPPPSLGGGFQSC